MFRVLVLVATLLAGSCSVAAAAGFGLGLSYGKATITQRLYDYRTHPDEISTDLQSVGVSLIFDTAVAKDKLLNLRLSLGYEHGDYQGPLDSSRGTLGGTFGFALLKNQTLRLWAGPRLVLGYGVLDDNKRVEGHDFNVGLGPVLGANFHLSGEVSLGLELGYDFMLHALAYERVAGTSNSDYSSSQQFTTGRAGYSLSVVILFRTSGDAFVRVNAQ